MKAARQEKEYDVVVVGSGIAGGITALVLSRLNLRVLVVEVSKHPRFAIGESTLPTTTYIINRLAEKYKIPELKGLTQYTMSPKAPFLGCTDYAKLGFWFGLHRDKEELKTEDELYFETLDPPWGPDVHFIREKVDGYLASLFPKYGVDYSDRTQVADYSYDAENHICSMKIKKRGEDEEGVRVKSRFVVDATGHSAFFAKKFGLAEKPVKSLHTDTRVIYSHFPASQIPSLDEVAGGPSVLLRNTREQGTMHHCFDGGWIWVIPFDNDTVSVGVTLNNKVCPPAEGLSAEEEFYQVINRFPTVVKHLDGAKPLRRFVRKDRSQIYAGSVVKDGVLLTPHAAAFVDPLFSTGILMTVSFVRNIAPIMQKCFKSKNFALDQFDVIEKEFFRNVHHIDKIVAGTIESFRDIRLFRQYWRSWVAGTMYQYVYNGLVRSETDKLSNMGLYGANNDQFKHDVDELWEILHDSEMPVQEAAERMKILMDAHWDFAHNAPYTGVMEEVDSKILFKVMFKRAVMFPVLTFYFKRIAPTQGWLRRIRTTCRFTVKFPLRKFATDVLNKLGMNETDKERVKRFEDSLYPWYGTTRIK